MHSTYRTEGIMLLSIYILFPATLTKEFQSVQRGSKLAVPRLP